MFYEVKMRTEFNGDPGFATTCINSMGTMCLNIGLCSAATVAAVALTTLKITDDGKIGFIYPVSGSIFCVAFCAGFWSLETLAIMCCCRGCPKVKKGSGL